MNVITQFRTRQDAFAAECKIIDLRYEYGNDYTGTEKYGVITALSQKELENKYLDLLTDFTPYIVLPAGFGIVRDDYWRNEKKFEMRRLRGHGFTIDNEFEEHHPECAVEKDYIEEMILIEREKMLYKAINSLSEIQKRRLIKNFFHNKSIREIAREEGTSHSSVSKSINAALKEIKKFF